MIDPRKSIAREEQDTGGVLSTVKSITVLGIAAFGGLKCIIHGSRKATGKSFVQSNDQTSNKSKITIDDLAVFCKTTIENNLFGACSSQIPDVTKISSNIQRNIFSNLLLQADLTVDGLFRFEVCIANQADVSGSRSQFEIWVLVESFKSWDLKEMTVREMDHAAIGDGE